MENTVRDPAATAAPQNDWQDAENNASPNDSFDAHLHAMAGIDDPDSEEEEEEDDLEDNEDNEEEEEEESGDWGHIDPAESNSPFPDSNAPSAPGSAV